MTEKDITNTIVMNDRKNYICFPQCKTGLVWGKDSADIIDVWAMRKSWTDLSFIAYEIKTSRSDFLNDNKWPSYLPFCNELYFITTGKEVCTADEMPEGVGLKYVSKTGRRIFTKKKAVYRQIDFPEELFIYILMSRHSESRNRAYWENWLRNKDYDKLLGNRVSKELSKFINDDKDDLERQISSVYNENSNLTEVKEYLDKMGIDYKGYAGYQALGNLKKRLNEISSGFSEEFSKDIDNCIEAFAKIKEHLDR